MTDSRDMTDGGKRDPEADELTATLKRGYGAPDIGESFSRALLLRLESELESVAAKERARPAGRRSRQRTGVAVAGLVACATIGVTLLVVFLRTEDREPASVVPEIAAAPELPPEHVAIHGLVVDESGKPLENVRVVHLGGHQVPAGVLSRRDGTFLLPLPRPIIGYQSLVASSEDRSLVGIHNGTETAEGMTARINTTPVRIVLKPAHVLRVRVADVLERPVRDAAVDLIHRAHLTAQARTDAGGIATLRLPRDMEEDWQVLALKPGVGFDYVVFEKPEPGKLPREADLVLDGARSLKIRAVDTRGAPLPGALFFPNRVHKKGREAPIHLGTFAAEQQSVLVRTGGDGIAELDWLPPLAELIEPPGIRLDLPRAFYLPRHLERVLEDTGEPVEVTLWKRAAVSGVVLTPRGTPAPGVLLRADGLSDLDPRRGRGVARSGRNGSYTMLLAPEHIYMLSVIDDRWAAPSRSGIRVRESEPQEGVDFRLTEGTVIRGTVTDRNRKPVPGQPVTLTCYGDDFPPGFSPRGRRSQPRQFLTRRDTTDAEGRYSFRVGPGDYVILVGVLARRYREEIVVRSEKEVVLDFQIGA